MAIHDHHHNSTDNMNNNNIKYLAPPTHKSAVNLIHKYIIIVIYLSIATSITVIVHTFHIHDSMVQQMHGELPNDKTSEHPQGTVQDCPGANKACLPQRDALTGAKSLPARARCTGAKSLPVARCTRANLRSFNITHFN